MTARMTSRGEHAAAFQQVWPVRGDMTPKVPLQLSGLPSMKRGTTRAGEGDSMVHRRDQSEEAGKEPVA